MKVSEFTLFIQASNVHVGGGLNLLIPLLFSIPERQSVQLLVDSRAILPPSLPANILIHRVKPSLLERLRAEYWLRSCVVQGDHVLCFGNLPPLFKLHGWVSVFVQNRYLIEAAPLTGFTWRIRARLIIERLWLRMTARGVGSFVVQTKTMQRLLSETLRIKPEYVHRLPYIAADVSSALINPASCIHQVSAPYDFIYPASGDPHKNHRRLIDAWCLLAEQGVRPRLLLTINETGYSELCEYLAECTKKYGLDIVNEGYVEHESLLLLFRQSKALIYPSIIESFGIPLLEGEAAGLPILAGELDYVRDVVTPVETFDVQSPLSIARAVRRFWAIPEQPNAVQDASAFLAAVLKTQNVA